MKMHDEEHDLQEERAVFLIAKMGDLAVMRELPRGEVTARLRKLAQEEMSIPGSKNNKLSLSTLKRIRQKLLGTKGTKVLYRKQRSDKGGCRAESMIKILDSAKDLKKEQPYRSVPMIIDMLERAGKIVPPGSVKCSTLRRQFQLCGYTTVLLTGNQKTYRRFERKAPGELYQADAADGIYLPDPKAQGSFWLSKLIVILDDCSRRCVGGRFYENQQQFALDDCFQRTVLRHGLPLDMYVDRGNIFVSKHFRRVCAELRVHLIKASVAYPEGKGKIERFVKTCKDAFYPEAQLLVRQGKLKTLEELNEYLDAWVEQAYNRKSHSELNGQSPLEVWGTEPIHPVTDPTMIWEAFLWRRSRTVEKDCCFPLEGVRFYVGAEELARKKIEVAYDPRDLSYAWVYHEGRKVGKVFPEARPKWVTKKKAKHPEELPQTGISYLDLLRRDYDEHLKREDAGLSFRNRPDGTRLPSRLDVVRLLEKELQRPLSSLEMARVDADWQKSGLWDPSLRVKELTAFVAEAGQDRHVDEYLACLHGR